MSTTHKYTLQDIRRRKAEVARQIADERAEMQSTFARLTDPSQYAPKLLPWRGFASAYKFVSRVVYAYKVASSVVALFKRRR